MNATKIIIARFDRAPTSFDLTINKTGTGLGKVLSHPAGIDCGEDCAENYLRGDNILVTLSAVPDEGAVFRGWNGACSGRNGCTVRMLNDKDITATFSTATPATFMVSNLNDSGTGSLRQAILDANVNPGDDIISFSSALTGVIALTSGQLTITDSLIMEGPGANALSISGSNASRILQINPGETGTVTIHGLTLKEGHDTDFSAA